MLPQPELGLVMLALDGYGHRWNGESALRPLCNQLIISLAQDGERDFTRTERALLARSVRWYLRRHPSRRGWLEGFLR